MNVTLKQIAELAGVSRGTVDRVLHSRPGVKPSVAERVIKVANELNYKPNIVAKALAENKNLKKIGVIVSAVDNPFLKDVIRGMEDKEHEIQDFGFEVIILSIKGYVVQDQLNCIDKLISIKIDGLIIAPIEDIAIKDKLNYLTELKIPIVTLNTDINGVEKIAYVGCDYYKVGAVAASFFGIMSRGESQKVGIVTGSKRVLSHNLRISGFIDCIQKDFSHIKVVEVVENNDNDETSAEVTIKLLEDHPDISGLFFCAAGVNGGMLALNRSGFIDKVEIITVDLIDTVRKGLLHNQIIATICQEPYKQGFTSVKIMFEYLIDHKIPDDKVFYTDVQITTKYNL